ncbi:MAG: endo-1,4-beta-xylanase [Planctomycetaceae bacterium]
MRKLRPSLMLVILPLLLTLTTFGQSGSRLRVLAPPSFGIGGVLHGYGGSSFDIPGCKTIANREFNTVTATAYMGWNSWDWNTETPNYNGFTRVVDWSLDRGKRVHGHVLLYPLSAKERWGNTPDWLVQQRVEQSIDAFASVRAGKVWCWDVANEVMGDDGDLMDGLGLRTHWEGDTSKPVREYYAFGGNSWYVEQAFHRARAQDPNAVLLLNEYGVGVQNPKSDRYYNYVKYLVENTDTPIDGVGFQMHWTDGFDANGAGYIPSASAMSSNMKRFVDLGLKVYVTELDVAAVRKPNQSGAPPTAQQSASQATVYQNVLKACLTTKGCEACMLWDFCDSRFDPATGEYTSISWLHPDNDGDYRYAALWWTDDRTSVKDGYALMQTEIRKRRKYMVQNGWGSDTGFLGRSGAPNGSGGWNPGPTAELFDYDQTDTNIRFYFERAGFNRYRIRCVWGSGSGYLTRKVENGQPSGDVEIRSKISNSSSRQIWVVEQAVDPNAVAYDVYRIKCLWNSGSGYLTRDGVPSGNGYDPSPTVGLYSSNPDWSSQYWRLGLNE